ncbi:hypothetical protein C8Q75DRAFT_791040 [Abortiporus biennis]|nr:hypothetical protein C8Q75DRAFT_791040 [Abortiporus biennis]
MSENTDPTQEFTFPVNNGHSKKTRRQVAFYPNVNSSNKPQKPFSRSAAKRESVMALGSIEHLQHYFTKSGIASDSVPLNKPNSGMVPAIGGPSSIKAVPYLSSLPEFELPPSPAIPEIVQPAYSPYVKTYEIDPENLRPGAIDDLSAVEYAWNIREGAHDQHNLLSVDDTTRTKHSDPNHFDVLDVLKTTTRAVRSVRNYILSLPDDSATPLQRDFTGKAPKRQVSQPNNPLDPLSRIRRTALEVLIVLRSLEESSRLPLSDDAYDAQSEHEDRDHEHASNAGSGSGGGVSRGTSPDFLDVDADTSISFIQVGGGSRSVPVWDNDEDEDLNHMSEEEKKERWDEKLVLGGGWLYRQDIKLSDLSQEKEVVSRYLDVVDEVLFGGSKEGKRGWEIEKKRAEKERTRNKGRRSTEGRSPSPDSKRASRRVVSTGMLDAMRQMVVTEEPEEVESLDDSDFADSSSVDDDELPEWAKRHAFPDNPYERLYSLLLSLLPTTLQNLLPVADSSPQRSDILLALSSGQLLCIAYNTGVRRSRKPWGYVSKDSIHDIAALEAEAQHELDAEQHERTKKGWTFRRTDNLRLWAAALKLRYLVPVVATNPARLSSGASTPIGSTTPVVSPSPSMQRFPSKSAELPIIFDAPVVARHDFGWEEMLERLVLRWMQAVIDERRSDR